MQVKVIHETRITTYMLFTKHESRTVHWGTESLQSFSRPDRTGMTTEELFLMSSDARSMMQTKAAKARFTGPPAFPGRATVSPANGFSRHTRHESRTLPPPGRCFPARCGAAWGGYGAAWAAAVSRSRNTALAAVRFAVGGQGGATKIRRRTSVSSEKSQLPCRPFPTISRYFPAFPAPPPPWSRVRAPFASATRPVGFSRHTRHESRTLPPPGRCFPARCGAAMARHGRPPSPAPATRPVGFLPATNHATWFFPVPPVTPRRATPTPASGFSRITSHGFYDDE